METGKYIKKKRIEMGISQKELGNKVGLTQQAIALLESGKRRIDSDLLFKLSEIFNVDWLSLINGEDFNYDNSILVIPDIIEKLKKIKYHCISIDDENYAEHYYITFPDGTLEVTEEQLIELNKQNNDYLKFQLEQLKQQNIKDFKPNK
jgi:transcriptional regulator with XRE-family HTH domain